MFVKYQAQGGVLTTIPSPCVRPWRGAPSINLLARLNAPLARVPSQQISSPHNSWRTGPTRLGVVIPPRSSTRNFSTGRRSEHLRKTVSLALSGQTWGVVLKGGVGMSFPHIPSPLHSCYYILSIKSVCRSILFIKLAWKIGRLCAKYWTWLVLQCVA